MRLDFHPSFLRQVGEYHAGVQRPSGTFFADENILENVDTGDNGGENSSSNWTVRASDRALQAEIDRSGTELSSMTVSGDRGTATHSSSCTVDGRIVDTEGRSNEDREKEKEREAYLLRLSEADREVCAVCGGRRQIYCGDCGGVRLPRAGAMLPDRVRLPFDVLLIVHW